MDYDFIDRSTLSHSMDIQENFHSYPLHHQQQSDNMNSNTYQYSSSNYQTFYYPSSIDSQQYHGQHFDYSSSTYSIDPYSQTFSNDTYYNPNSIYLDSNTNLTPSPSLQWNSPMNKTVNRNVTSTSNSDKQPCLVCHEQSSGYHFGAYTCESCKAFYLRVTKDPNIELKHSCDIPLPNITKFNRKDCRACRKAKCEQVGMTLLSKDRSTRMKTTMKSSSISVHHLLQQLTYDLTSNQTATTSSALENLFQSLDLSTTIPMNFDYYSLYTNAIHLWRNQFRYSMQTVSNQSSNDSFAVLLVVFYCFMIMKENFDDKSMKTNQFDRLIRILQDEINLIDGIDHRSACRIKAQFMKCYVLLAQYYSSSPNLFDSNQQYSFYNQ